MNTLSKHRGLSLLEVAIAFAITFILIAATMPNFQDYGVRARVSDALAQAVDAQSALVRTCMADENAVVRNNADADYIYHRPLTGKNDFVDRVLLTADCADKNLVVTIWTYDTGATHDPVIEWTAKVPSGVTTEGFEEPYYWNCRVVSGDFAHVPAECRKSYRKS